MQLHMSFLLSGWKGKWHGITMLMSDEQEEGGGAEDTNDMRFSPTSRTP